MSIRSLLTVGLLAVPAVLALPNQAADTKTVTTTKTKTKTVTDKITKTVTEKTTKTKTVGPTSYKTVTVGSSCASSSFASTPSSSASASSATATSSKSGSSATSATSSSATSVVVSTTTSSSASQTTTDLSKHTGTSGLNDYAKATGKVYFGTAADIPGTGEYNDKYYMAELNNTHDFGQLTAANVFKWQFMEPEQGVFDYTGADDFVAIAKANDQIIRCHNLNWYNQNPNWLTEGSWTNETILAVLENHIANVVAHFGDECYAWDVVNEALNDDGTFREDIWYNTTGTSYIPTAFAAAEKAIKANKLNVKLYYNDYNIEYLGNKSTAARGIVSDLQNRGIQIDGVGLQSHFIVGKTPSTASQVANMEAFTALGVDVAVTELDVRTTTPASAANQQQQVLDYASTVAACAQVAGCVGITVWDFDDTYSWIPTTFAGQGYGDLFFQPAGADTPLVRKAAYDGVIDGLTGVVPTLATS